MFYNNYYCSVLWGFPSSPKERCGHGEAGKRVHLQGGLSCPPPSSWTVLISLDDARIRREKGLSPRGRGSHAHRHHRPHPLASRRGSWRILRGQFRSLPRFPLILARQEPTTPTSICPYRLLTIDGEQEVPATQVTHTDSKKQAGTGRSPQGRSLPPFSPTRV